MEHKHRSRPIGQLILMSSFLSKNNLFHTLECLFTFSPLGPGAPGFPIMDCKRKEAFNKSMQMNSPVKCKSMAIPYMVIPQNEM